MMYRCCIVLLLLAGCQEVLVASSDGDLFERAMSAPCEDEHFGCETASYVVVSFVEDAAVHNGYTRYERRSAELKGVRFFPEVLLQKDSRMPFFPAQQEPSWQEGLGFRFPLEAPPGRRLSVFDEKGTLLQETEIGTEESVSVLWIPWHAVVVLH